MQGEGPSSHFAKKAALQPFCMLQLLVNKTYASAMRQDAFESCCENVTKYKGNAYGEAFHFLPFNVNFKFKF